MDKDAKSQQPKTEDVERVKKLIGKNKAAALGLAVVLTLTTSLAGCGNRQPGEDEEDDSYYSGGGYYGGGSYFYTRGGSYKSGSWGKSYSYSGKSGYSSIRGGSIGS